MSEIRVTSRSAGSVWAVGAVIALGTMLTLSGCAAPARPAGAAEQPGSSAATASPADTAEPIDDLEAVDGNADGTCALLSVARANQLAPLASPFAAVQYSSPESTGDRICSYQSADYASVVSIIEWHEGFTFAQQTDREGTEVVPGSPETVYGDDSADVALDGSGVISAMSFGSTPLSRDALVAPARAAAEGV